MPEKQKPSLNLDNIAADWNISADSTHRQERVTRQPRVVTEIPIGPNDVGETSHFTKSVRVALGVGAVIGTLFVVNEFAHARGDQEQTPWKHTPAHVQR